MPPTLLGRPPPLGPLRARVHTASIDEEVAGRFATLLRFRIPGGGARQARVSSRAPDRFQVSLRAANGEPVWGAFSTRSAGSEAGLAQQELRIPVETLPAGDYALLIESSRSDAEWAIEPGESVRGK
ncbi:MAG: hypothetical protein RL885_19755 [Planctomycetota bacterium]